jgi:hypothetical protein
MDEGQDIGCANRQVRLVGGQGTFPISFDGSGGHVLARDQECPLSPVSWLLLLESGRYSIAKDNALQ